MRRQVSDEAVEAIRLALKRLGVEFINENGGGPGVRLRKPRGRLVKSFYLIGTKPSSGFMYQCQKAAANSGSISERVSGRARSPASGCESNAWCPRLTAAMILSGSCGPGEGLGVVVGFGEDSG